MIKNVLFSLIFSTSLVLPAQSTHGVAFNAGYTYINTNAGYIGGEYAYRINPKKWMGLSVGVGTYFGSFNRDFKFIPEAHINFSYLAALAEFSITEHSINPSVGINILNGLRLKGGYSWKMGNDDRGMKGVTFGINFLLGTRGFYDAFGSSIPYYPITN